MPMTVTESHHVNKLLHYVLGHHRLTHGDMPTSEEALTAAACLADSAHKRLLAGFTGDHVREAWDGRRVVDGEQATARPVARGGSEDR